MSRRIGWYVHHQGLGHLVRMRAIAGELDARVVCFSSLAEPAELPPNCTWIRLPRDDEPDPVSGDPAHSDPTAGGLLHWAPIGHRGHRHRLGAIAEAVAGEGLDAFVVDVSVEVTLFVRLLGIRTIVLAQPGDRSDAPHRLAFDAAERIVAPWPEELLRPAWLQPVRHKTVFTGGISRFEGRALPDGGGRAAGVLLLGGRGGQEVSEADVRAAAAASGGKWRILGGPSGEWADDPWRELVTAPVVVSWAGQNAVADLAAVDARAIVIPQPRPFDEQRATATALRGADLAVVVDGWPEPPDWPGLLARASALSPDWGRWRTAGAARRAADAVAAVARA